METIKVNMSPNPLDVQTIHASQNDGEARQWEFELHNNGELIDTSDVKEQLVFKAYKGGTEQLLPENGSTPTTSPIIADIKYPQGLLTDQEFTYRQSPTEEDGLAKITDIKGNTLVWNQWHYEQSTTYWSASNATSSYADGNGTFTASADGTFGQNLKSAYRYSVVGHKYLFIVTAKSSSGGDFNYGLRSTFVTETLSANTEKTVMSIRTATTANDNVIFYRANATSGDTLTIKNSMCFDLTQMGLDISSPSDFTSLFSLPYYSYNQGSLLSFMGNGIKTVGKNLLPPSTEFNSVADITINADNGIYTLNGTPLAYRQAIATNFFVLEPGTYRFSKKSNAINNNVVIQLRSLDGFTTYATASTELGEAFTLADVTEVKFRIAVNANAGRLNNYIIRPMLEFGSVATDFEPYTSSTLSLPISTYFPTGMKSAGSVYDELTPNKATARLKEVTFSSVSAFDSSGKLGVLGSVADTVNITRGTDVPNDRAVLETYSLEGLRNNDVNGITQFGTTFYVRLQGKTTLEEYNTYLSANPLTVIYELATPIETSFTTASLVTENAEIPLSNEDGILIGKCTEQLSENPGFIDAKIKLSDADGECYSNKLQLHVERSPQ